MIKENLKVITTYDSEYIVQDCPYIHQSKYTTKEGIVHQLSNIYGDYPLNFNEVFEKVSNAEYYTNENPPQRLYLD